MSVVVFKALQLNCARCKGMKTAFLTEIFDGVNSSGIVYEKLKDALKHFSAAICAGVDAKVYALSQTRPMLLMFDTKFYK